MALSERAIQVKEQLTVAVTLTRALEAARQEWEDLLYLGEAAEWQPLAEQWVANVQAERYALQKQLAEAQLKNWAMLRRVRLTDGQWRIMRLRYVQGLTWAQMEERCGCSKQYLLREHNRALEQLASGENRECTFR